MSKFSIDGDLLGVISFVVKNTYDPHLLTEIHETLKPQHIEGHIVALAFEILKPSKRKRLLDWVKNPHHLLSVEEDRYFRDIGFLYGDVPALAEKVRERCEWMAKYEPGIE